MEAPLAEGLEHHGVRALEALPDEGGLMKVPPVCPESSSAHRKLGSSLRSSINAEKTLQWCSYKLTR